MKRSSFNAIIKAIEDFENEFECLSIKNQLIDCDHCEGQGSVDLFGPRDDLLATVDCKKCNGQGTIETDDSSESYFSHGGCDICNIQENESGGAGDVFDVTYLSKKDTEKKIFDNIYEGQLCGSCLSIICNGDVSGLEFSVTEEDVSMENPKLVLVDCCLPDYFQGHKNLVFVAHVDNKTTIKEVFDQLEDDSNIQEINLEYCGFTGKDCERAFDRFKDENLENFEKPCFPGLPDCDDFENLTDEEIDNIESVVAYFTVIDEE